MKALFTGDISLAWLPPVSGLSKTLQSARAGLKRIFSPSAVDSEAADGFPDIKTEALISANAKAIGSPLSRIVEQADLFCANLESVLSNRGQPVTSKKFTLRAHPEYARLLKRIGLTDVSLANNHILDYGADALEDTCSLLQGVGIRYCGVRRGMPSQDPQIAGCGDTELALFSYVDPAIIDPDPEPFLSGEVGPFGLDMESVLKDIAPHAGKRGVVVIVHWGEEWSRLESERQRDDARELIDNGVSLVIGHHSHVAGAVEEYRDGLIAYSLGNLYMDLPPFSAARASKRCMLMTEFRGNRLDSYSLLGISAGEGSLPRPDEQFDYRSLMPGEDIAGVIGAVEPKFDSQKSLSGAVISTPDSDNEFRWSDDFLVIDSFVRGLFPMGPGWSARGGAFRGVRTSREYAGDRFLAVAIVYCQQGDCVEAAFNLPESVSNITIITGYPDSLDLQTDVRPCTLSIVSGSDESRQIELKTEGSQWHETEMSVEHMINNRKITLRAGSAPGFFSVACFRILGM